jgi:hypothetical protein
MKKLTKREKFEMVLAVPAIAENEVLREFIQHEMDLLVKKNSGEKKPTATQVVNEGIKSAILEFVNENEKFFTITDFIKQVPECADMSNQRVNALVRQLLKAELVDRTEIKGRAYFHKPGLEAEEVKGE